MDLFNYSRRETSEVNIGATPMGGSNPIRIQSMTNTATQDTEASVAQAKRIVDAGGEYVRLTAQGIKEAENLMNINAGLRRDGYMVPLVADIHFNPKVADVAAQYVEKVRINPGNYVDAARTFKHLEYTDEEYAQELQDLLSDQKATLIYFRDLRPENTGFHLAQYMGLRGYLPGWDADLQGTVDEKTLQDWSTLCGFKPRAVPGKTTRLEVLTEIYKHIRQ